MSIIYGQIQSLCPKAVHRWGVWLLWYSRNFAVVHTCQPCFHLNDAWTAHSYRHQLLVNWFIDCKRAHCIMLHTQWTTFEFVSATATCQKRIISGIHGYHLPGPRRPTRVYGFQSEQSPVECIVVLLCQYFDPCVNRFLSRSLEGAHLACHFTANELTQFATVDNMTAPGLFKPLPPATRPRHGSAMSNWTHWYLGLLHGLGWLGP